MSVVPSCKATGSTKQLKENSQNVYFHTSFVNWNEVQIILLVTRLQEMFEALTVTPTAPHTSEHRFWMTMFCINTLLCFFLWVMLLSTHIHCVNRKKIVYAYAHIYIYRLATYMLQALMMLSAGHLSPQNHHCFEMIRLWKFDRSYSQFLASYCLNGGILRLSVFLFVITKYMWWGVCCHSTRCICSAH